MTKQHSSQSQQGAPYLIDEPGEEYAMAAGLTTAGQSETAEVAHRNVAQQEQ